MNPYSNLVADVARVVTEGRSLPLGGLTPGPRPEIPPDAPKALFFAPHPDDETIAGGLALRLLREAKWNVIDVAITLGSLPERKAARLAEARAACHYLGFGLEATAPDGLANVRPTTRAKDAQAWSHMVAIIASFLEKHRPKAIFFPHQLDWNDTHIGVHLLVMDALKAAAGAQCYLIETEFWGQMQTPNLLVEYSAGDVADLVAATSFHAGEVQRNPYHVLMPAWMQDNVRRGAELVGGQGGAAPHFMFAQVYRARKWDGSEAQQYFAGGRFLPASTNPATLFP
ncbi:MAG TPA: PIG-L family deacetylase [Candidatus Baltobacteraceae bacterium]|jgi:LmbE family N-acetylglucosaminyl deacetylase|nr:PIG-L family deacetylase [Candidatus Baltobacteraceae bacterium]